MAKELHITRMKFGMYDVIQIDWRKGQGWQDYMTLKTEDEFRQAVNIVKGGTCQSMPHWIPRSDVSFRIVDSRDQEKLGESDF